jgi:hypothetical protein
MRELLVSYLLGACNEEERRRVEYALIHDSKLRRQFEHIRRSLAQDGRDDGPPPSGLAERTVDRVSHLAESEEIDPHAAHFSSIGFVGSAGFAGSADHAAGSGNWTVVDMVVASGVVLAIGMLLVPALRESRSAARLDQCKYQLVQLGRGLTDYSRYNHRYFPVVRPHESAGMYAVRLVDSGFVDANDISKLVVCPAADMAEDLERRKIVIYVPSSAELFSLDGTRRYRVIQLMGGSYAYRLGFLENGRYRGVRNQYSAQIPVLADAPRITNGEFESDHHGTCGQNVLYQDLSVRYLQGNLLPDGDHLFLNALGLPAAGRFARDCVLARSEAKPAVE